VRIEDYGLIGDMQAVALDGAFSHLTLIVAARAISAAEAPALRG
jgi:hypothetical protein